MGFNNRYFHCIIAVLAITAPSTAWAGKNKTSCPAYIVDKESGVYEEIGKFYQCFSNARQAEAKDYFEELMCAGGKFETVAKFDVSGSGAAQTNTKVFEVTRQPYLIETAFNGDGQMTVYLVEFKTGKSKQIISTQGNTSIYAVNESGLYYVTVKVSAKNRDDSTLPSWSVSIYEENLF